MFGSRRKIIVRGERVHLLAPNRDTAADFVAFTTANKDFHQPWVFPATDVPGYRHYLERLDSTGAHGFLVARNEDDALAGVINLNDVVLGGQRSASLGYYGTRATARRGYMTEGLALVLDQAFGSLGLHRIEANVQPANAASLALIAGLGFRREGFSPAFLQIDGVWCDHERWAILENEWKQRASTFSGADAVTRARRPLSRVV
ncbi:MAG: N-acetyltransferase [Rhodospirillaceae bacterium]|nr:MAG: N-acetyltransferase [Rhodospirillaceae bacterium]